MPNEVLGELNQSTLSGEYKEEIKKNLDTIYSSNPGSWWWIIDRYVGLLDKLPEDSNQLGTFFKYLGAFGKYISIDRLPFLPKLIIRNLDSTNVIVRDSIKGLSLSLVHDESFCNLLFATFMKKEGLKERKKRNEMV
jgi:hypothetical protein